MLLRCTVQQYAWGRKGSLSEVARLRKSSDPSFSVSEESSYAELWMGTHPSGPSRLAGSDLLLSEYLQDKPHLVGSVPDGYVANDLPFLFKVLSVQTALSIQAHPDKALARELHASFPQHYKDPNHKPEMVIAVTPFEAMCGFRSLADMHVQLTGYPELRDIIGGDAFASLESAAASALSEEQTKAVVRQIFCSFMECDDAVATSAVMRAQTRLSSETTSVDKMGSLILRLMSDYPGDRGVLAPLLLNYIELTPGQAFFMGPNEPHAYLFGDCVECMALSDNVVRAGLTPKFRHVDALCSMLYYKCGSPELIVEEPIDAHTHRLRPDPTICAEFEVDVSRFTEQYSFGALSCASILLVLRGMVSSDQLGAIPQGSVLFLPANEPLSLVAKDSEAIIYRAHVNLSAI